MPNAVGPLVVLITLDLGNAILVFAGLSFLGLGVVPPTPEWGSMVSEGRELVQQWWVATFPGIAILTVVMGFNFVGDGLRDWLDPHARTTLSRSLFRCSDLRTWFFTDAGVVRAVDGVSFDLHRRRNARHRRRIRLRQERRAPSRSCACWRSRRASSAARSASAAGKSPRCPRTRTARDPRRRDRDGVPGPDDLAQPGAAHRRAS